MGRAYTNSLSIGWLLTWPVTQTGVQFTPDMCYREAEEFDDNGVAVMKCYIEFREPKARHQLSKSLNVSEKTLDDIIIRRKVGLPRYFTKRNDISGKLTKFSLVANDSANCICKHVQDTSIRTFSNQRIVAFTSHTLSDVEVLESYHAWAQRRLHTE